MNLYLPKGNLYSLAIKVISFTVLLTGLTITFFTWQYARENIEKTAWNQFNVEVNQIEYALSRRIKSYYNILYSLQGFFAASDSVERREWNPFVNTSRIADYPDISYVSYIEIVKDDKRLEFIEAFRDDKSTNAIGYPNFKIYPEGVRDVYAVVKYIEPEDEESSTALGFDLYSSPSRKVALDKAAITNKPVASEIIRLVTDNSSGFFITVPIYVYGEPVDTADEKKAALTGFVNVAFKTRSLFDNIFSENSYSNIFFTIHDGDEILYESGNKPGSRDKQTFSQVKTLEVGGRIWSLEFISKPSFATTFSEKTLPWVVGIAGSSLSLLLFGIIYYYGKRASQLIKLQSSALEAAVNCVVITDTQGVIQWVNPAFTKLTGYEANEAIGQSTRLLHSGKQDNKFYEDLWNTISSGKVWNGELINKRKDGSLYREEQTIAPVKDKRGNITNFIAIKQDITQRKLIEERLMITNRELEESKRAMVNLIEDIEEAKAAIEAEKNKDEAILASIGDGLVIVDSAGRILMVNKTFESLLGWKREEVLGKLMIEVIPMEDEAGIRLQLNERILSQVLAGRNTTTTTTTTIFYYVGKNKTRFPAAINVSPIITDGKIMGAVEVFRDVTREKEIDKAKSEFVSIASHQLRTPLGIMKWYLEALKNENYLKSAPPSIQEYFEEVYKSNERVLSLVRSLLSVSRIDQGKVKDEPQPVDIVSEVKEVLEGAKIAADKKNIQLSSITRSTIPSAKLDPMRLREVIENLVTNAVKYTPNGGKVEVSVDQTEKGIVIQIKDTGIGISEDDKKQLFTKFFRGEKATAESPEGSGLGLYVAKSYVEGWGGTINVESAEGQGSIFTVVLPVSHFKRG